ncbi:uncharacterized protein LOC133179433 [Saccostrea echinata]|uniref:uncharacterized protein LOC133179433 n=1 Tax=Saccostrea echinata TaxID=191078 RepID=UPI002A839903|nr:uncharacterized protein LOC133179433 [Saccostrea echinata]
MGQTRPPNVPIIRRSIENHQLPENVTSIIMSSWRRGTTKQYRCYLNKWEIFCSRRNINSLHTSVNNVLIFLTELYETGIGYSAINTAKSALSNVVSLSGNDSVQLGNHALVKRFMKGIFNSRPSLPKYTQVWDVSLVLQYLKSISIEDITLKQLTLKTVMLLAVLSGQRVQTLAMLSITNMCLTTDSVQFYIDQLLKQSRPGKHLGILRFQKYHEENVCIIKHLNMYVDKTKHLRDTDNLLVSYQKPHGAVTPETISRWIKSVLAASGIDTTVYSAHSTRAASTSSAVAQGCPIDVILKQVGWSRAETFGKFYNKTTDNNYTCTIDQKVLETI